MTQQVSIKDRDGLKAIATEIGLEYPSNIPTNKLIEAIQEKIEENDLDILLVDGKVVVEDEKAPKTMSVPASPTTLKQNVVVNELLPLSDDKSFFESPEDMDHSAWTSISGLKEKLKGGVEGKDHKLAVQIFSSDNPSKKEEYKVEGGPNYVMVGKGGNLGFEVQATAIFEVTKTITETVPDPDGEEGATKEVEKEVVEDELRTINVSEYFDSVTVDISYTVKEEEVDPEPPVDPPVDPEPETKLVNGINTIMGFQFEYDASRDHAFIQISDNLLKMNKMYYDLTDEILLKGEGPRLVLENKFLKKIRQTVSTFDIYDARSNNVISCQQFADRNFYHDVRTIIGLD